MNKEKKDFKLTSKFIIEMLDGFVTSKIDIALFDDKPSRDWENV
jgi:hypothetical protein